VALSLIEERNVRYRSGISQTVADGVAVEMRGRRSSRALYAAPPRSLGAATRGLRREQYPDRRAEKTDKPNK
jgi:hypothetical protein